MKYTKAVRVVAQAADAWLMGADLDGKHVASARNLLHALNYPSYARWVLDHSPHSYENLYIPKYEKRLIRALEKLAEEA